MLMMHQDASLKRQPEHTPEKGEIGKLGSNFTESGAKQDPSQYPNGNYMDLMPGHQQTTEKTTAMTDEHLLKRLVQFQNRGLAGVHSKYLLQLKECSRNFNLKKGTKKLSKQKS